MSARPPVRIAPSLLSCDFARIADEIADVERAGADWLHVDVMDGHFVPNLTIGPPVVAKIKAVARCPLDVHLMITDPWKYADAFLDAGADVFTFHLEVAGSGDAFGLIDKVRARGVRVGMALNPDADVAGLEPYLPHLDMVLVMSVFPGFGGQRFMPEVLAKAQALRQRFRFRGDVEMDGGIDPETIAASAAAGTNVFVAGTAIFGVADRSRRIADLRKRAQAHQGLPAA
ncbi:MAG: ribulose-phosphate 3-epimerase [Planctomycetota bacterium]